MQSNYSLAELRRIWLTPASLLSADERVVSDALAEFLPARLKAEQRVLDAMAAVPEETLRRSVANVTHAPEHSRAPARAELARRGLKP